MKYDKLVTEHLRLTLLRLLFDQPSYTQNESFALDAVVEYGFAPSRDRIRTEFGWLAEQGLVSLGGCPDCRVATLTARGEDVASGRATCDGVKRPSPRS